MILENLRYPWILWSIIPLAILLFFIIRINFVRFAEEEKLKQAKRHLKVFMYFTRLIIFSLLIIAFASPFMVKDKLEEKDPFIKILVDNSTSMGLFETSFISRLKNELNAHIGVELKYITPGESSAIGNSVLDNLENEENILLVTDGNNNYGSDLGDVALYAKKINSSVSILDLKPVHSDVSVTIGGPSRTMADVENTFKITVNYIGDREKWRMILTLDDEIITDEETFRKEFELTRKFKEGYHLIKAEVTSEADYFPQNNVYYKTVNVVPKPKILLYSKKETPFYKLLTDLYEVKTTNTLNLDLSPYYAIVFNDIPSDEITTIDPLTDYLTDGNGLVVLGGRNSYDLGNYKDSVFETLLPVFVSRPGKKEGDVNVVIVLDISGSSGSGGSIDIEKALALSVFKDIRHDVNLGVVAFNDKAYTVSEVSPKYQKIGLETKISSLKTGGSTYIETGLYKAIKLLEKSSGSKNIILITDGMQSSASTELILSAIKLAGFEGIKVYTVGVGGGTSEGNMKYWADLGKGIYFKADKSSKLKLIFGKSEEKKPEMQFLLEILDDNHFITAELEKIDATIFGYNQVVPKQAAKLLVTTNIGDPLLAVWRYGLGRVASLTTDDGSFYAGEMLSKENSKIIVRMMNWVIATPDRKRERYVNIKDTVLNQPTELAIKTTKPPAAENVVFYQTGKDLYAAEIMPPQIGFNTLLGATYSVNHAPEYSNLGINPELESIIKVTGGKKFNIGDLPSIIEHVRSTSKKVVTAKTSIGWLFVLGALIIYLFEITVRRIVYNRKIYK